MNIEGFVSQVDFVFGLIFWISVAILIAITFCLVYFLIRYHHTRHKKGKDIHGNLLLELAWTGIPTLLVLAFFYFGMKGYQKMERIPEGSMTVETTGSMWFWRYQYANGIKADSVLRVPVNKPIHLALNSTDVIHSYYIPAFRIKKDVVPGIDTDMWFISDSIGEFQVFCAEYCGDLHSNMLGKVQVMSQSEFDNWYAAAGETVEKPASLSAAKEQTAGLDGAKLYQNKICFTCHTTDGSPLVGPTFKGLFGKSEIVVTNGEEREIVVDDEYLRKSIKEPAADITKGFANVMVPLELTDAEIDALIEFIKAQK